jgi:hypothetical protein
MQPFIKVINRKRRKGKVVWQEHSGTPLPVILAKRGSTAEGVKIVSLRTEGRKMETLIFNEEKEVTNKKIS